MQKTVDPDVDNIVRTALKLMWHKKRGVSNGSRGARLSHIRLLARHDRLDLTGLARWEGHKDGRYEYFTFVEDWEYSDFAFHCMIAMNAACFHRRRPEYPAAAFGNYNEDTWKAWLDEVEEWYRDVGEIP